MQSGWSIHLSTVPYQTKQFQNTDLSIPYFDIVILFIFNDNIQIFSKWGYFIGICKYVNFTWLNSIIKQFILFFLIVIRYSLVSAFIITKPIIIKHVSIMLFEKKKINLITSKILS